MPITFLSPLDLSQIPIGHDGSAAGNERNTDMVKINALFSTNAFTPGSVIFANASGKFAQDNAGLNWDDTNNRLGIGTSSPSALLHLSNVGGVTQLQISDSDAPSHTLVLMSGNVLSLDITPTNSSSAAAVNIFRSTNTTAATTLRIFKGDNTATQNAQIAGNGDSFLALDNGSVGIGTSSIDASAKLEIMSTTKGLLLSRLTTAQRDAIASPTAGLLIYNSTTNKAQIRTNSAWVDLH